MKTLLTLTIALAACAGSPEVTTTPTPPTQSEKSIADIVTSNGDFSTLAAAVKSAGLADTLAGEGPFTVFAPTDEAFARLPEGAVAGLDKETLKQILTYHVVASEVPAKQAVELSKATAVNGKEINLQVSGGKLYLNGLTLVTSTDIKASNGVIHVIDSVLLPGDFPGTAAQAVSAYPRLSKLLQAASNADAGVLAALTGEGPITLFAPINAAFAGVDTTSNLTPVLLYHVIVGQKATSNFVASLVGKNVKTANGATFMVGDGPALNDGQNNMRELVRVDLITSNGVIHVIDGVLMPPAK